ncbi:ankyrin repeat-containing protein-like, partial [Tropilaelaps mercedesae]
KAASGLKEGKCPPRPPTRRRQVKSKSSLESPRSSAMFPYMVSGDDEDADPEHHDQGGPGAVDKTSPSGEPPGERPTPGEQPSPRSGKFITERPAETAAKTRSSDHRRGPADGGEPAKAPQARVVTSTQTEQRKERIKEVHIKEVKTFSSVKTREETREEIVTVELKRQGLDQSGKSDDERVGKSSTPQMEDAPKEPGVGASTAKQGSDQRPVGSPGSTSDSPADSGPATAGSSARRKRAQWNKSGELAVVPMGANEPENLEPPEAPGGATTLSEGGFVGAKDAAEAAVTQHTPDVSSSVKAKSQCKKKSPESRSSAKVVRGILGDDVGPDDLVTLEMVPSLGEGAAPPSTASRRRQSLIRTIKVRDILDAADNEDLVIRQAELRASNVASPPSSTTPAGSSDEEIVEFVVRHGREKNIFWLPASRITQDRKWQVTFVVAKTTGSGSADSVAAGQRTPLAATAEKA